MERGDLEIAMIKKLTEHRDLSGPAMHAFVALYSDPGTKYTRRKLAKLLGYHRNTMATAVNLLESKGLVRCPEDIIKLVNIMADL